MAVRCGKSHVEVDGLGLIILEELGYNDAPAANQLLNDLLKKLPPLGPARVDTVLRIDSLKKAFLPRGIHVKADCILTEDQEVNQWVSRDSANEGKKQTKL